MSEQKIIAVGFISLLIALAGFALMWFDIWLDAKLIVQISVLVGVGAVAVGLLLRLIGYKNKKKK
ncbi:hypothetical protein QN379_05660 [Glaciimonas sp. Gout2]|uniref:hypothetical protein n=1 Tax=unclassified Glaciimonas TaxID=2644401 RepID=UPI002B225B18|nr:MULTISPECIES: hypothetical protein [unclassified Glaciimonas]MEB0013532.1 hypothetical protein [Glaciimonas sp. Cout2]MEB0081502.1 hypothetical protein [Glaciimonas sp. Gout2]